MNGKKDISDLNIRVVIRQWDVLQDSGGGTYYQIENSWTVWANKRNRSGSQFNSEAQEQWQYNTTFKIRYNPLFKSNMTIDEGSQRWKIDSIEIDNESYKEFMFCRCSTSDIDLDIS